MAERAGWGETKDRIIAWCEGYFTENGRIPVWSEVKQGTGAGAATLSTHFTQWKSEKEAKLRAAQTLQAVLPAEVIPVPVALVTAIEAAWSTALSGEKAAAKAETEAIRIATKSELEKLEAAVRELEQINSDLAAETTVNEELHETALSSAAAALAERDAAIEALRREVARVEQKLTEKDRELAESTGRVSQLAQDVTRADLAVAEAVRRADKAEAMAEQEIATTRAEAATAISRVERASAEMQDRADKVVAKAEATAAEAAARAEKAASRADEEIAAARKDAAMAIERAERLAAEAQVRADKAMDEMKAANAKAEESQLAMNSAQVRVAALEAALELIKIERDDLLRKAALPVGE